jgi:hypothetical protein
MIGNTSFIIEGETFGQPTSRAKWKIEYGGRPEDIQGLAVEEQRDRLFPLAAEFHGMAREAIESFNRHRRSAALAVERLAPINIVLVAL